MTGYTLQQTHMLSVKRVTEMDRLHVAPVSLLMTDTERSIHGPVTFSR
jgi:hypothetical protein